MDSVRITEIIEAMLPKGYTCKVAPEKDGLCDVEIKRPDGKPGWSYVGTSDGVELVKMTGRNVIAYLGGKAKKDDEEDAATGG